jgi:hypothetical protein
MKWNQSGNNEIELFQVWLKVNCNAPCCTAKGNQPTLRGK